MVSRGPHVDALQSLVSAVFGAEDAKEIQGHLNSVDVRGASALSALRTHVLD
jgi:hypothetical protein